MDNKIEQLTLQKNNLYRDNYRRMMKVLMVMILVGLGLLLVLSYQIMSTGKPKYYATTTTGRVVPLQSLDMPVVTNRYLLQWAVLSARTAYNFDFLHYEKQLQGARTYFTDDGWDAFMLAIKNSGVMSSVMNNKLFMSAVADGPAVILHQTVVHGRHLWRVQLPLLVTFRSSSENRKSNFIVTMDVVRVPVIDAAKSIQINNFNVVRR